MALLDEVLPAGVNLTSVKMNLTLNSSTGE